MIFVLNFKYSTLFLSNINIFVTLILYNSENNVFNINDIIREF